MLVCCRSGTIEKIPKQLCKADTLSDNSVENSTCIMGEKRVEVNILPRTDRRTYIIAFEVLEVIASLMMIPR